MLTGLREGQRDRTRAKAIKRRGDGKRDQGNAEKRAFARAHATLTVMMMMPFNCSYRNKNVPTAIYPSLGYSPPRKEKEAYVMMPPP